MISFSVIPPARSNPQRYTKMCVISPHNSAGMVIIMVESNYQVFSSSQSMFAQSELKLLKKDEFVGVVKKHIHPGILPVEIRMRTFCGKKPSEGACSGKEHFYYPGHHPASHKSQVGEEVESLILRWCFKVKGCRGYGGLLLQ